jgi:uncharacterized protein (TIGR02596 family)
MKKKPLAFTILELLIVIGILCILAVVTMPSVLSSLQGIKITQGTQVVLDQITLARQLALSRNRGIETRFYGYKDSSDADGKTHFQGIQNFELQDDGTAKPLGKMVRLPSGIILDASQTLSTLLSSSRVKQWTANDTQISLPQIGTSYDVRSVVFRPDGCTDLAPNGQFWFVTLHAENAGDNLAALTKNFSLIQIDPWTGGASVFRP